MLPYFAAAGHNLYAKSAYLYLQNMQKLEGDHPVVFKQFQEGHHVVRRSDRYWAGLSTDLVIEQVLMRSLKTQGGLTRGRGMSETQRLIWLLSMPACAEMNCAMQDFTGITYETSDQHIDMSKSRQERDLVDTDKILNFLVSKNPFDSDEVKLRSIASGVTASKSVNVDNAKDIGMNIVNSMIDHNVSDFTFRRKDHAVVLSASSIEVDGDIIQIDPQLLFQRLIAVKHKYEDTASLFKYELCSYPPALFDNYALPREADKPDIANTIWLKAGYPRESGPPELVHYVVDGGGLLHRIPWNRGMTFGAIVTSYVDYVTKHYPMSTVVFDGYAAGPTTKDVTHQRRSAGRIGVEVKFTSDMILSSKKEKISIMPRELPR